MKLQCFKAYLMAAGEGFEPSQTESESVVLPLHNPAIYLFFRAPLNRIEDHYTTALRFVKGKFAFLKKSFFRATGGGSPTSRLDNSASFARMDTAFPVSELLLYRRSPGTADIK